ncbi:helix-turn-helix domain-containing protein [Dorea formicigenerans]|uniref:XRE family transcriptional regulator n=1 Tax=Dorea formicigenerans TaxID=39486 RepID=A0A412F141_9FIRM|nr:helix-turn-helix transcriptional regulator [Dorea formicigenerans]RGR59067.1 XRE family transcriptional regulator [Dorea formicigenerans]
MTLKEYIKEREYRPEFKGEFARYQPEIECARILIDAQSEQNLSLKELAKITGIRYYELRKILNGKRVPTLEILQKIADGLSKTVRVQII